MPKSPPAADGAALYRVAVAVEAPAHSGLSGPLDYVTERPLAPGTLVRVPFGRREVAGVVWDTPLADDIEGLRPVLEAFDALPPLPPAWRELVGFAAGYYQRSIGEL
ncbi:MAG TPA: primosomal protein N', partial [Methylibium sp.]|nr:primosomal protein N' [Methylibium sp.]